MHDDVGYDSVRVTLGILVKKGHLERRSQDRRYLYRPSVPRETAVRSAIGRLVGTFFGGSPSKAILAMLDLSSEELSEQDLDAISAMIERERES